MEKTDKIFLLVLSLCAVATLASNSYMFLLKKDYDFNVEASCDPTTHKCFHRDCANPGDCPPNGLSNYRRFTISAKDFQKCSDNSCIVQCKSGAIQCVEIKCGDSVEDTCNPKN